MEKSKTALIIGAGPGGLTAAYELLKNTDIKPIVIEASDRLGGISCTHNYKGNRIDIGGHRFFSKSDRVMEWWQNILPIEEGKDGGEISYQGKTKNFETKREAPSSADKVMLLRNRKSRIYHRGKFFDYPITLSIDTIRKLGMWKMFKIGLSYIKAAIFPYKSPKNLEEFYVNQFGRELYNTFFRDYTEKLWGVKCKDISAEWGAQRVKGLSLRKTVWHFFKKKFSGVRFRDKKTETSLIEQFLYPKYGPGQMWEIVAEQIKENNGEVHMQHKLVGLHKDGNRIVSADILDPEGNTKRIDADYFFSTMPINELLRAVKPSPREDITAVGEGLLYRDFITVGVLLKKLKVTEEDGSLIKDTWIYIQEPSATVGRIQIFNNWSPALVKDPDTVWIGLEYFCSEGDKLWSMSEDEMKAFGVKELAQMGLANEEDVIDSTVIKMKKTYPGYFGSYDKFGLIREYVDSIVNFYPVGRNGMHKYNNQDHSMLTAMISVENIKAGRTDKSNIWAVNTEQDYHEEKK